MLLSRLSTPSRMSAISPVVNPILPRSFWGAYCRASPLVTYRVWLGAAVASLKLRNEKWYGRVLKGTAKTLGKRNRDAATRRTTTTYWDGRMDERTRNQEDHIFHALAPIVSQASHFWTIFLFAFLVQSGHTPDPYPSLFFCTHQMLRLFGETSTCHSLQSSRILHHDAVGR
jgi:hypothetical protein